jgi:hypothetical protein
LVAFPALDPSYLDVVCSLRTRSLHGCSYCLSSFRYIALKCFGLLTVRFSLITFLLPPPTGSTSCLGTVGESLQTLAGVSEYSS